MTGSRRQLLEERQHMAALELTADDHIAFRAAAVGLKSRLGDIETDCRDRLHACRLRIVVTASATTSMALTCPWESRPQHQKQTLPFGGWGLQTSNRMCLRLTWHQVGFELTFQLDQIFRVVQSGPWVQHGTGPVFPRPPLGVSRLRSLLGDCGAAK